jgi:hypothetical protein
MAPIWLTGLPYDTIHLPHSTIWLPSALNGSHKPSASCMVQSAPIWPPYSANGSHMVPSISHMAHTASTRLQYGAIWLSYGMHGAHTVHTSPIRCTRLPHCDTTPICAPYCARSSHMAPSACHMVPSASHMAPHGSHKPSTSSMEQSASIWPPSGAVCSHMVPGSHMAPASPIECIWLPYGHQQLTDPPHSWHNFGSHVAHTQLPYDKLSTPIWAPYGAIISHMLPPKWRQMAPISHPPPVWCTWFPYCPQIAYDTIHIPYGLHSFHMSPTWCQWLLYGAYGSPIRLLFGTIWLTHGQVAPLRLLYGTHHSHMVNTQIPYGTHGSQMTPIWCMQDRFTNY